MRISDWSSDVCSSDLENNGYGGKAVDFSGKRVGVIGTGATGVQIISEVAKTAAELVVFQRHPNWCAPLCNSTIDQDRMDEIKRKYDDILAYCNSTTAGFQHEFLDVSAQDVAAEERDRKSTRLNSSH